MNRTKIKNYAPQARRDFLQAVTDRAAFYGLTADRIEPVTAQGDVAIIGGRAFPREVGARRKALQERVERDGFGPTMEALAYTWFNRLVAIRYMELHGYLDHGYRVLSHPDPARAMPEILEHAEHVELPGLNRDRVVELKLDGTKEVELYRLLLVAQCNALHSAMPFLFERIGGETELVLPESLLHSDSIVRKLVSGIDEEDWQEVEIVGWLYEAYVSERKDRVIGKVVAISDIPAATQLFTPKWIVRYLVQNTLGHFWMATYPQSGLRQQMEFYIEPAEQTTEVQKQLTRITPTTLDPEAITFLDPACGSAHILVEAYDLFRTIYQERGYRARDIPRLILGKNLFGLEIDDRAAQLAAFALMMKARADDRRIFEQQIQPQVRALVQTDGMDAEDIAAALNIPDSQENMPPGQLFETEGNLFTRAASMATAPATLTLADGKALIGLFEQAKTFGSPIQVPATLAARLPYLEQRCREIAVRTSEVASRTAARFLPVVEQARMLTAKYNCVATNPPYMGTRGMVPALKAFSETNYPSSKQDLFSITVQRSLMLCDDSGRLSFVTPFVWMFLVSYSEFRSQMLSACTITSLIHLEYNSFEPACVPVCLFTLSRTSLQGFVGQFIRLCDFKGVDLQPLKVKEALLNPSCPWRHQASKSDLMQIPGWPIAYWVSQKLRNVFSKSSALSSIAQTKKGMATGDNNTFVRTWAEVSLASIGFGMSREGAADSGCKWFPYANGGDFRKWSGHHDDVVLWEDDGRVLRTSKHETGRIRATNHNLDVIFREGLTWSAVSSVYLGVRLLPKGFLFSSVASSLFTSNDIKRLYILGFLNSKVANSIMRLKNPTMSINPGDIASMPVLLDDNLMHEVVPYVKEAVSIASTDWDSSEWSWSFATNPLATGTCNKTKTCSESWGAWTANCADRLLSLKRIEEKINELFIESYGLQDELSPEVPDDQIILYRPDRAEDVRRLISYAVGCTMGRYSLDKPGLVYAHGGNVGFDPAHYRTFHADPDGIVPVMEADWFADDAANRFVEFLGVAWPREHLEENLTFVADALGPSRGEQPRDTIRRYLATGFYKHHLQTYKRRPIYWLFSSGRQRAFQCLVYLHRYHEGTLSRMRTEYVIPLQGKLASRIDQLAGEIPKATSTSHRNKLTKERDALLKQQAELQAYDEKLRHHADMRITLDLDDGVKVNYGKFGDLLAEVRAVTGGREEE